MARSYKPDMMQDFEDRAPAPPLRRRDRLVHAVLFILSAASFLLGLTSAAQLAANLLAG
jgi:hypothetical protein